MLPTNPQARLEIGRQAHEKKFGTVAQTALHFHVHQSNIYSAMKEYRDSVGIVTPGQLNAISSNASRIAARQVNAAARQGVKAATAEEKKERDRKRHKRYRETHKAKKAALNSHGGNGQQLVPVAADAVLQAQINEMRAQLEHTMDEVHTLQKILMTVGKAL